MLPCWPSPWAGATAALPLLYINFVENAFKHGVSYERASFISILLHIDEDSTVFRCCNSKQEHEDSHDQGVGLKNVRQRLHLIYGDRYKLNINDGDEVYEVTLTLPAKILTTIAHDKSDSH